MYYMSFTRVLDVVNIGRVDLQIVGQISIPGCSNCEKSMKARFIGCGQLRSNSEIYVKKYVNRSFRYQVKQKYILGLYETAYSHELL